MTEKNGQGYDKRLLYYYIQFYQQYPEIMNSVMPQSLVMEKYFQLKKHVFSWTPYRVLLQIRDPVAHAWYEQEDVEVGCGHGYSIAQV